MKLLIALTFSLLNSVAFLFYLSSINNFLPFDSSQSYNWTNIVTVVVLFAVGIFSLVGILLILGQLPFKKKISNISWYLVIKYSGIVTLFLLILGTFYFFHIFTWYWILALVVLLGILIVII